MACVDEFDENTLFKHQSFNWADEVEEAAPHLACLTFEDFSYDKGSDVTEYKEDLVSLHPNFHSNLTKSHNRKNTNKKGNKNNRKSPNNKKGNGGVSGGEAKGKKTSGMDEKRQKQVIEMDLNEKMSSSKKTVIMQEDKNYSNNVKKLKPSEQTTWLSNSKSTGTNQNQELSKVSVNYENHNNKNNNDYINNKVQQMNTSSSLSSSVTNLATSKTSSLSSSSPPITSTKQSSNTGKKKNPKKKNQSNNKKNNNNSNSNCPSPSINSLPENYSPLPSRRSSSRGGASPVLSVASSGSRALSRADVSNDWNKDKQQLSSTKPLTPEPKPVMAPLKSHMLFRSHSELTTMVSEVRRHTNTTQKSASFCRIKKNDHKKISGNIGGGGGGTGGVNNASNSSVKFNGSGRFLEEDDRIWRKDAPAATINTMTMTQQQQQQQQQKQR